MKRYSDILLLAMSCAILFIPGLGLLAGVDISGLDENRGRTRPPSPRLLWNDMERFAEDFERYFQDSFAFRDPLILTHNKLLFFGLGVSPSDEVVVGKDGWLFFWGDGIGENLRRRDPFTEADLDEWRRAFQSRKDWLAARSIPYVLVLVPDKATIMSHKLPEGVHPAPGPSRLDQLVADLRKNSDVPVLDLRHTLQQHAKDETPIYHLDDTHWNYHGAYWAYRSIYAAMDARVPLTPPITATSIDHTAVPIAGDLSRMLGFVSDGEGVLTGREPQIEYDRNITYTLGFNESYGFRDSGRPKMLITTSADPALPTLLMMHDSFGEHLIFFMAEHFTRGVFVWDNTFDPDLVEQKQPDIFVEEFVERRFNFLSPDHYLVDR